MTRQDVCHAERLTLYHYDELPADQRQALEAHLQDCLNCRVGLEELQACLAALPPLELKLNAAQKLRFTDQVAIRSRRRPSRSLARWGAAMAAAGALALSVVLLRPTEQIAPAGPALADFEVLEQLDMLQELDLLQELELLQALEELG